MYDIDVYAYGICHSSVCVPATMPREEVERLMNSRHPTGIRSCWAISDSPHFSDGLTNPCPCSQEPHRQHWLMVC